MSSKDNHRSGWRRALAGLALARRGSVLLAACGLLLLTLGALGRAGCGNPHLPEVRSLVQYQSLLFHLGLLLGFLMVVGGQLWASLMPVSPAQRAIGLGCGALSAGAMLLVTAVAQPGRSVAAIAPPGGASSLAAAALATTAVAATTLLVMLVSRSLGARRPGSPDLTRRAALFGVAMVASVAANAEAASGLVFSDPLAALYEIPVVAAINVTALVWLHGLLLASEEMIRAELAGPTPAAGPAPGDGAPAPMSGREATSSTNPASTPSPDLRTP